MIISDSKKFIFFHVPKNAGSSLSTKLAPFSNMCNDSYLIKKNIPKLIKTIGTPQHQSILHDLRSNISYNLLDDFYKYGENKNQLGWMNFAHYRCSLHLQLGLPWSERDADNKNPYLLILSENWSKYEKYTRFAFVRNSWDYIFSLFKNKIVIDDVANKYKEGVDDWDEMVSIRLTKQNFVNFIHNMHKPDYQVIYRGFIVGFNTFTKKEFTINQLNYFSTNEKIYANNILRFENLETELKTLEKKLQIPLTTMKYLNKSTKNNLNYKDFYDQKAIDLVGQLYKKDIEYFKFEF